MEQDDVPVFALSINLQNRVNSARCVPHSTLFLLRHINHCKALVACPLLALMCTVRKGKMGTS